MGTSVICFYARCCHEYPHFTGEKSEALRSQNLVLADPKEYRTPPPAPLPGSLPVTPAAHPPPLPWPRCHGVGKSLCLLSPPGPGLLECAQWP